ncbi:hypothetical protein [Kribbella kalugense]|uniref:Uncharacterized protein n=1 Tax=Kribbella kalugense TaxID=2512221 RepID=A0A4R7ZKW8_9ACTN|nr:hypothetical protein [Kribbella kalugense]TDW15790.1 hypothetical protein EV650_7284 [Kribbella kalugense]
MTTTDELRPGKAMMWLLSSTFSTDDEAAKAFSVQSGRGRQAVLGKEDRVGDEPRLLVDFNAGQHLLSVRGQQVGDRHKSTVHLWGQDYHIHRRFRLKAQFDVTNGDRTVLQVRQQSPNDSTVRTFETHSAPDLDPIAALALMLLQARPDKMKVLGELFRH